MHRISAHALAGLIALSGCNSTNSARKANGGSGTDAATAAALSKEAVARMQEDRIGEKYNGTTGAPKLSGYGLGWWIDRVDVGVFSDGGAYGSVPWLDLSRDYAAFLVIESESGVGGKLFAAVKLTLDTVFDTAKKP
jgi:CubicO group peptidase (beta-lactamase class C family)